MARGVVIRSAAWLAAVLVALPLPAFPFETPLSDTAVRDAYFLGQRRDEAAARFLNKYTKYLPPPKSGPYIYSVAFFTPFALVVQDSSERSMGYSAQQAWLDHENREESVKVVVQINQTGFYSNSTLMSGPSGNQSGSSDDYVLGASGFWKAFHVQVSSRDKELKPSTSSGHPNLFCGDDGCISTGATLELEFPAKAFDSDSATVIVSPPRGKPAALEFDLASLR